MKKKKKTAEILAKNDRKEFAAPYTIHDIMRLGYPHVVIMSIELPYLDWCRFEQSDLYRSLTNYLEGLQQPPTTRQSEERRRER